MMNKQGLELKKKLEHSQEQRELYFKQSKELKTKLNKARKQLNEYGRKLKALEIIKEKKVNVSALLELDNLEQYNDYCALVGGCKYLTQ